MLVPRALADRDSPTRSGHSIKMDLHLYVNPEFNRLNTLFLSWGDRAAARYGPQDGPPVSQGSHSLITIYVGNILVIIQPIYYHICSFIAMMCHFLRFLLLSVFLAKPFNMSEKMNQCGSCINTRLYS
jgi:hypothetical protein